MRTTPDPTFTTALRDELEERIRRERAAEPVSPARGRRASWLISAVATIAVLLLVAGVSLALTHLPRPATSPTGGTTTPAAVDCSSGTGFAPFPCNTFTVVKGTANGAPLAWPAGGSSPTIRFRFVNGSPALQIHTSCRAFSVDVRVTSTALAPLAGPVQSSTAACPGDRGDADRWIRGFFSHTVRYTAIDNDMVLASGSSRLVLTAQPDPADGPAPLPAITWNPDLSTSAHTVASDGSTLPACTSPNLTSWGASDGGGAGGTFYQAVFVRNDGPDCSLGKAHVSIRLGDGTATAPLTRGANGAFALPSGAIEQLDVQSAEGGCIGSTGTQRLEERLGIGGVARDLDATFRYPTACPNLSFVTWQFPPLDTATIAGDPGFDKNLRITVQAPAQGGFTGGTLDYTVTITNTGSSRYVPTTCPTFVQVEGGARLVTSGSGTLNCTASGPIPAHGSTAFSMRLPAPHDTDAVTAWYLKAAPSQHPCQAGTLTGRIDGNGGGVTGNWAELLVLHNSGPSCTLPAEALAVGGRQARGGSLSAGIPLPAAADTRLALMAATTCDATTENVDRSTPAPVVLTLGGGRSSIGTFPTLRCADPFIDRF